MSGAAKVGDAVTWRHVNRGGYGYVWRIPAVVVSRSAKRVRLAVLRQDGGAVVYRSVLPDSCGPEQPHQAPTYAEIRRLLAAGGEL